MTHTPFTYIGEDSVELLADDLEGELRELVDELKTLRVARHLSLDDVSADTGIDRIRLARFEAGLEDFDSDLLVMYALAVKAHISFHVTDYEERLNVRKLPDIADFREYRSRRRAFAPLNTMLDSYGMVEEVAQDYLDTLDAHELSRVKA